MSDRMLMQGPGANRCHILVQLRAIAGAESPVGIDSPVVVYQDAGIEPQFRLHRICERPPGRSGPGHHDQGSLLFRGIHVKQIALLHHVRCVQNAPVLCPVADSVAFPVRQVRYRC